MKNILLLLLSCFIIIPNLESSAQSNLQGLSQNPIMASEASFLNPAYLSKTRKFQLNIAPLMGINLNVNNNFVSAGNIIDYMNMYQEGASINFKPVHAFMDNLRDVNTIMASVDMTLLNATYRVGNPNNALHIGLSVRQHINANFTINDDFFKLIYGGNKQFAGETITLHPELSAISYTDIGLGASKVLNFGKLTITPAARFRYLIGNAAAYSDNSKIDFYTQANGDFIELSGNIDAYAGGVDYENLGENLTYETLMNGFGRGYALDLGLSVAYKNLSVSIASIDNGSIQFKKDNSKHYTSSEAYTWEGYDIVANYEGRNEFDGMFDDYKVDEENKAFKTGIGSKITINANYGLMHKMDVKNKKKKRNKNIEESSDSNNVAPIIGYEYYVHNFGISAIQGFENKFNASTKPMYALYYQLNLKNKFTTGINFNSFGNIYDVGFNLGTRGAGFNWGIGSNSLIALIDRNAGKQFDLFFQLGLAF